MNASLAIALSNVGLVTDDQVPANDTSPVITKGNSSRKIHVDPEAAAQQPKKGDGKKKRLVTPLSPAPRATPPKAEPKPAENKKPEPSKAAPKRPKKKPASPKAEQAPKVKRPRRKQRKTPAIRTQLMGTTVLRDEGEIVMVRVRTGMHVIPAGLLPHAFLADYVDADDSYVAVRIIGKKVTRVSRKDRTVLKCRLRILEQVFSTHARLVVELERVADSEKPDSGFAIGELPEKAAPVFSQRVPEGRKTLHVFPLA